MYRFCASVKILIDPLTCKCVAENAYTQYIYAYIDWLIIYTRWEKSKILLVHKFKVYMWNRNWTHLYIHTPILLLYFQQRLYNHAKVLGKIIFLLRRFYSLLYIYIYISINTCNFFYFINYYHLFFLRVSAILRAISATFLRISENHRH